MKTCSNCVFFEEDFKGSIDTYSYGENVCVASPQMAYIDYRKDICSLYKGKGYNYEKGILLNEE